MRRPVLLTIPGYTGSGPHHWQSHWERDDPSIRRVEQADWNRPDAEEWSAAIERMVEASGDGIVLIAHSCGVTAVAHWAARTQLASRVAGAFLVAPPDDRREDLEQAIRDFGLPVLVPLPFPSVVVASEDDPYCDLGRAAAIAQAFGAHLRPAGRAGHINTASGHGPWPEGRALLFDFCQAIGFC